MICGNCGTQAATVSTVRACHDGTVTPCNWLVRVGYDEDGTLITRECGAHTTVTDRGWSCEAGHEHVYAEVRQAEGWEYAEDAGEARLLARAGVDPVPAFSGAF